MGDQVARKRESQIKNYVLHLDSLNVSLGVGTVSHDKRERWKLNERNTIN